MLPAAAAVPSGVIRRLLTQCGFLLGLALQALSLAESGEGRSRRVAEQEAARRMLDALNASDKPGSALQS